MSGHRPSLLVAEDDAMLADQIRWALKDKYRVRTAVDRIHAIAALRKEWPDLVLLDLCLPPDNTLEEGFRILKAARSTAKGTMVVVMSATDEREAALRAVAEGAYDFFSKPVDLDTLRVVVSRALERQALERENGKLRQQLRERFTIDGIVGISKPMQLVLEGIQRVQDSPVTVIIEGESGTGKELIARAIHYNGARREGPFIPVHCGALPESLLEAELFGHERGAFTGAVSSRIGRFEAAHQGTLFLDEIATLTPSTQIKLLRVLEERAIERLGSQKSRPIDIRLIVATNENLEQKVQRGEFREDLFFRINVFPLRLPPLRERTEDIPLLANHFLKKLATDRGGPLLGLTPEARDALMGRPWPGNVRELSNLMETLALTVDEGIIDVGHLPMPRETNCRLPGLEEARKIGFKEAVQEYERNVLREAIGRAGGAKNRAARMLRLDPSQMKYLVRKHHL